MADEQRREVPIFTGSELETAVHFLDFQREVMLIKCAGLTADQVRRQGVPSGTNLLGLIQHLAVSEEFWFHHHVAGDPFDKRFNMDVLDGVSPEDVYASYERAWARSNAIITEIGDLSRLTELPVMRSGQRVPLRWVIAHMTTETARHAGHADILREQLDGATGR